MKQSLMKTNGANCLCDHLFRTQAKKDKRQRTRVKEGISTSGKQKLAMTQTELGGYQLFSNLTLTSQ